MEPGGAPFGLIPEGAIVTRDERVEWVGPESEIPAQYEQGFAFSLHGDTVTPALIDCHTHLVFGGNRAKEFAMRLRGVSYESIARQGGGITSTMRATRRASVDALVAGALPRLDALLADGVGTVEIKSGYGLDIESEIRMLRAARRLAELRPVHVVTSWLAAHAVPPEYGGRPDDYISKVVIPGLHLAHEEGLVDAVDGFCESIAFSNAQMGRVFDAADDLGLPIKLHAEQLTGSGAAKMAAERGALSADHLEYLDQDGVDAMAQSGTVAALLPGAFYSLQQSQPPPVSSLRAAGVPMAVATDANPGSSPLFSLLMAMNMACTLFGLRAEEALAGTTHAAAKALGIQENSGTIAPGKRADLAVWNVAHPAELAYWMGYSPLTARVIGGKLC